MEALLVGKGEWSRGLGRGSLWWKGENGGAREGCLMGKRGKILRSLTSIVFGPRRF